MVQLLDERRWRRGAGGWSEVPKRPFQGLVLAIDKRGKQGHSLYRHWHVVLVAIKTKGDMSEGIEQRRSIVW